MQRISQYQDIIYAQKGVLSQDQLTALESITEELSAGYRSESYQDIYAKIQEIQEMNGLRKRRMREEGLEAEALKLSECYRDDEESAKRIDNIHRELDPWHFHG